MRFVLDDAADGQMPTARLYGVLVWADVEQLSSDGIRLRSGARRWSSRLPSAAADGGSG